METAGEHLIPDEYHESSIGSIYYDDPSYSLIRHSLDQPAFKEKLRLRSYRVPDENDEIFLELKKKYKGIVYKRRITLPVKTAEAWIAGKCPPPENDDLSTIREIDWFIQHHELLPKVFIGAERVSWTDREDRELRFTFDKEIRWRADRLSLTEGNSGENMLKSGEMLMEIKIPGAAPLWLANLLSSEEIFPESYSKYGTCYRKELIGNSMFAEYLRI